MRIEPSARGDRISMVSPGKAWGISGKYGKSMETLKSKTANVSHSGHGVAKGMIKRGRAIKRGKKGGQGRECQGVFSRNYPK